MSNKPGVPDAWDDDWVAAADKPEVQPVEPQPALKLTKAQKRAQHAEQQRKLWDGAENPDRFHWLESQGVVPLKQEFRPQVQVLSRKPAAPTLAKRDAANGIAGLNLDDDDDSETEARKKRESELEERQRKAKIEREEKQRKYAEARERIMGSSNSASPAPASRESSNGRDNRRSRGKMNGARNSQPTSTNHSPTRPASGEKLFDPEDMSKGLPKREQNSGTPRGDQPARQPRGPDSGARGGFGFAARGGRVAS